jgi:hypothetical protein
MICRSIQVVAIWQCIVWGTSAFTITTRTTPPATTSTRLLSTVDQGTKWDLQTIAGTNQILRCEGQSRKTFNYPDTKSDTVMLGMESDGRPIKGEIELWIGPNWNPFKLSTYSQNGQLYPIQSLVGTRGRMAQIEVRNTAPYEFPFNVACSYATPELASVRTKIPETEKSVKVQGGGMIHSIPLELGGSQTRIFFNTPGRNLNVKVELLNGPNNCKQWYEAVTGNGVASSLYLVFDTPGSNQYTLRIMNKNTVEFPVYVYVAQFFDKQVDEYGYTA